MRKIRKYGRLSKNDSINDCIYICFNYISEKEKNEFAKKFLKLPQDSDEILHTFRELILGAYLNKNNLNARYQTKLENKTPDWIINNGEDDILCVVELINFHLDKITETKLEKKLKKEGEIFVFWRDSYKNNVERLYQSICSKATTYKSLIRKLCMPYVVSIFSDFRAAISFESDLLPCLKNSVNGIYEFYPELSGVLFFEDKYGKYYFRYEENLNSQYSFFIPDGSFP